MPRKGHIQQILQVGRANCMHEFGDHRLTPVDSIPINYILVLEVILYAKLLSGYFWFAV